MVNQTVLWASVGKMWARSIALGIRADIGGVTVCPKWQPLGGCAAGEREVNEIMLDHLREVTEMMLATIRPGSGIWRGCANLARPS